MLVLGLEVGRISSAARAALRGASRTAAPPLPHLFRASLACNRGARPPCWYDAILRRARKGARANASDGVKAARCLSWAWRWGGYRAPPARRFAGQVGPPHRRSHICFGPVSPVIEARDPLLVRRDIEAGAKRGARQCFRNNWPGTNVGAAVRRSDLPREAPRGRRSIFAPLKNSSQAPGSIQRFKA